MGRRSSEYVPDEALQRDLAQPFPDQRVILPNGNTAFVPTKGDYHLANPALPINQSRDEIVGHMTANRSFIVATATGSGKTLELPKMALETDEYDRIYVTQPTVLGARNAASRLTTELNALGYDGEKLVGYRTANEGTLTDKHLIAYVTPRLYTEMVLSGGLGSRPLSILDEFHMRQAGTDLAFTLNHMNDVQTIISSATIDTDYIARRAREMTRHDYPVVVGAGRRYPVEERVSQELVSQTLVDVVKELKDTGIESPKGAVILPGEQAIRGIRGSTRMRLPKDMRVFRLTSESSRAHQRKAIDDYDGGSTILATNLIETSVTIPGLDFVIDSLYQRSGRFEDGVKRLPLEPASKASQDQRLGRVGRTKEGLYIQAPLDDYPVLPVFLSKGSSKQGAPRVIKNDDTPSYGRPEIESIDLSDLEIRLAARGMSLAIPLLTEPPRHEIEAARNRLRRVGALEFGSNAVTEVGKMIAKLNVDTSYARMIVEAYSYGERTALQMITAVAALQMKGVGASGMNSRRWLELTTEKDSDVLAQLDVMLAAMLMDDDEKAKFDIIDHRFENAVILARTLSERLGFDYDRLAPPTENERIVLLKSAIVGYQDIFVRGGKRTYRDREGKRRTLTGASIINTRAAIADIVLGEAIDIGVMNKRDGLRMRRVLKMVTAVNITLLDRTIPEKMSRRLVGYDMTKTGKVFGVQDVFYEKTRIGTGRQYKEFSPCVETDMLLVENMCAKVRLEGQHPELKEVYTAIAELYGLQDRTANDLNLDGGLGQYVFSLLQERAPKTLLSLDALAEVITAADVRAYISASDRERIMADAPDVIAVTLDEGVESVFDVTYSHNVAQVHVLPQHVVLLPDVISVNGRKTVLRVQGYRTSLTVAQANEHFGRESRWYRRGGGAELSSTVLATLTGESMEVAAGRVAISIQAQTANVIIVKHFNTKKDTQKKPKRK